MLKKGWLGYLLICVLAGVLFFVAYDKFYKDYDAALEHYRQVSREQTETAARNVQNALQSIYRHLRTVSLLPDVRNMDMRGASPDKETLLAVQHVFTSLVASAGISELYISPADPDLEKPVVAFDRRILSPDNMGSGLQGKILPSVVVRNGDGAEEYRLLREQAAWFIQQVPDISGINGMNVPVIGGHEIMTADDTVARESRRASDRSGIVLSVPVFSMEGKLKGIVSAVVLSHVLQNMMPSPDFAIVNAGYSYAQMKDGRGQAVISRTWVEQARPDGSLLYSEVLPLNINDPRSKWYIWAGHPDASFYESHGVRVIRSFQYTSFGFILALLILAAGLWASTLRRVGLIHHHFEDSIRLAEENSRTKFDFLMTRVTALQPRVEEVAVTAEDMSNDTRLGEEHRGAAKKILETAESLSGSVSDIMDFLTVGAQDVSGDKVPFNVRDVLANVVDMMRPQAAAKKLELEMEIRNGDAFPVLVGDPMPLGRIFANLVGNAIRYTPKGFVRVEATVEKMEDGRAMLSVDVVDSGPGIPFDRQKTLFEKPPPGMPQAGLGLVISRTLVEMLGGALSVESTEGVGSTFTVRVPFEAVY